MRYAREAWETAGRSWLATYAGSEWNTASARWEVSPNWRFDDSLVGPQAYFAEQAVRPALNMARVEGDKRLLAELAGFYVAYLPRFTTLGRLRSRASADHAPELLQDQGDDQARTLPWIERVGTFRRRVRECTLCNAQFLHPAARLLRTVAELPPAGRTEEMRRFAAQYGPLLVHDHLMRLLYQARWDYWGDRSLPPHLVDIWKTIDTSRSRPKLSYQRAMQDRDLWLIATAAEILGAYKADPNLIVLSDDEVRSLRRAVQVGVSLFEHKRRVYNTLHDQSGRPVRSATYFEGDFADHPEMAYAADSSSEIADLKSPRPARNISWDISHSCRIPIFLRSLWDNRAATAVDFPATDDVAQVANQYVYRVFEGDLTRPLFRNYLDGTDGWFHVDKTHQPPTGTPPSRLCDTRNPDRPCLTIGAVSGWPLLRPNDPGIAGITQALLRLANSDQPSDVEFRRRYYTRAGQEFAFRSTDARSGHSLLLFTVIAESLTPLTR